MYNIYYIGGQVSELKVNELKDLSLLEYSFVKLLLFNFRFGREITRTLEEILK